MTRWSAARQLLTSITSLSTTLVMRTLRKFHLPGAACHAPTNLVILALYWWSQKFFLKVFSSWEREPRLGGSGLDSLRSKRFQSSYCAQREQKKKMEGGGGGEKRKHLPANLMILENAPWYFTVRFICKLTARQNRNITNRLPLDYQICKITLFSNRTRCRRLQEL